MFSCSNYHVTIVSEPLRSMEARSNSEAEFCTGVREILTRHESNLDQIHNTLQVVLNELRALRAFSKSENDVNPFVVGETLQPIKQNTIIATTRTTPNPAPNTNLKQQIPKVAAKNATEWIFQAKQYFEFQNMAQDQQVHIDSFRLEGITLEWNRWLTGFKGSSAGEDFTKALLYRFSPTGFDDPCEVLTCFMKQTLIDVIYHEEFDQLSQIIDGSPDQLNSQNDPIHVSRLYP